MLYVKDLDRMRRFYGALLGQEPVAATASETWVEFESGLSLHAIPPHIAEAIVIESPPAVREETPIKLIFPVADLEAVSAKLEALGAPVTRRPWGACDCVDPEGNVFQIAAQSKP